MDSNNADKVITQENKHTENINRMLRGIKFEVSTNYIHSDSKSVVITTNKVAALSNLNIVEKYMKDLNNVDLKDTNLSITSDIIERVVQSTYIFNNTV